MDISEHQRQVGRVEDELEGVRGEVGVIRGRLDRHLEIYANNGKEMKRMADLLEVMHEEMMDFKSRTQPIIDVYNGVITVRGIVVGLASVIIALGAIGAGVIWAINQAIEK